MKRLLLLILGISLIATSAIAPVSAQEGVPGFDRSVSLKRERIGDTHWRLTGDVELQRLDMTLYASGQVDIYTNTHQAVAVGNVVFTQGGSRISADRAVFDYQKRTGTFYNATGITVLGPQQAKGMFGTQEPDVYFYGTQIDKIGPKKYRIHHGGFTTCVQPTPRWQIVASTATVNLGHYTILHNSLLEVKNVPLLYLPILYYPTKKDDRATGFLIPQYGMSTIRGQSISNAFFWAINRSQDATFYDDWYSKTGFGNGGEYRYNYGAGSNGTIRAYALNQHEATYQTATGTTTVPGQQSYEIHGAMNQALFAGLRARANVDYFSSLTALQTYNTNIYNASLNQRNYGVNVSGAWGPYSLNGTYSRAEYFYGTQSSALTGGTPTIGLNRGEARLFNTPLYVSVAGQYADLVRTAQQGTTVQDNGLNRFDLQPTIRFPFTKWQFFTVNSSLSWRDTFYTRSLDPVTGAITDAGLNRRYWNLQAQFSGPIFQRIFNTPNSGYAEKFKHSIEPYFNISRISSIDNFSQIVQLDGTDAVVGSATSYSYGVNSRLFAKVRDGGGVARDILDIGVAQSYYTNALTAQYDQNYETSFTGAPPSHFSPIVFSLRAVPDAAYSANVRAELDSQYHELRTISVNGTASLRGLLQTTLGWSHKGYIAQLPGFNDPTQLDNYLNGSANAHTRDNRVGGTYSFNYDILRDTWLQQRFSAYYNAQCCGIVFDYQSYNLSGINTYLPVAQDHRFNISFTLAGIGTFGNFFGALSGNNTGSVSYGSR
ncbi:MAG: LPS-assembly protein LptD [Acidobacteriota bacterium]|nr:LPS-assembly protein LptD [Acidobacteriota bacterium]